MKFTESTVQALEAVRWLPTPECQAFVNFIRDVLVKPESDGLSKLQRVYLTCDYENQRNEEIQAAAFALIAKQFKEKFAFFQADCPDDGQCRFHLRLARSQHELQYQQPAHSGHFLNLLKTKDEWIRPPLDLK